MRNNIPILFLLLIFGCQSKQEKVLDLSDSEIEYAVLPKSSVESPEMQKFMAQQGEYSYTENSSYHFYTFNNRVNVRCTTEDAVISIGYIIEKLDSSARLPYGISQNDKLGDIEAKIGKPDRFCSGIASSFAYYYTLNLMISFKTLEYSDKQAIPYSMFVEHLIPSQPHESLTCITPHYEEQIN